MTIIAEKQCAATPHPLRGGVPEGRGGVWTRLSCSGKRLLSSPSGRLHNQEYPFSEKVTDPTPNPSPSKGRGELRGLSYKGGENFGDYPTREGRTSGTILQGRGELRRLSYKGGENFGDYPTREGRTSETILQGRGELRGLSYKGEERLRIVRCSKGDFIKWA